MENISEHITYAEATASSTAEEKGLDNTPSSTELEAMKNVAAKVFEPIRNKFNEPIAVTSFFRSAAVNTSVGGSSTSQHCKGEAMDLVISTDKHNNRSIFEYIMHNLTFDQMIWEFGNDDNPDWVHVSLKLSGTQRGQMLRTTGGSGSATTYAAISGPPGGAQSQPDPNASTTTEETTPDPKPVEPVTPSAPSGSTQTGTVTASSLNVRNQPNTTSSTVIDSLPKGTSVTILETLDGWYKIESDKDDAYVSSDYVDTASSGATKTGTVTASSLNVRNQPNTSSSTVIDSLPKGTSVTILATLDGWYKIESDKGDAYVSSDYVDV